MHLCSVRRLPFHKVLAGTRIYIYRRENLFQSKSLESMCPCHGIHRPYCVPWHPETAGLVTQWDGPWRLSYHSGWVAALRAACMFFYKMWIRPEPVTNIWCCLFHSQNTGVLTPKKCGISHYNHQISLTVFTYPYVAELEFWCLPLQRQYLRDKCW